MLEGTCHARSWHAVGTSGGEHICRLLTDSQWSLIAAGLPKPEIPSDSDRGPRKATLDYVACLSLMDIFAWCQYHLCK